MENFVSIFNTLSAIGAVSFLLFGIFVLVLFLLKKEKALSFIRDQSLLLGLLISWLAVIGSLIYSDVIGYAPCNLCWTQRIFIYAQAILFTIAFIKNDRNIFIYTLYLSLLGLIVAIYHNWIDLGGTAFIACDTTAVSCTKRFVYEWGFVTIPLMSLSALLALFSLSLSSRNKNF
jgi:disulfide bond formation protein DsbB